MASEKLTVKNSPYVCFAKGFLGDIGEITFVATAVGEAGDSADYEVRGAAACG